MVVDGEREDGRWDGEQAHTLWSLSASRKPMQGSLCDWRPDRGVYAYTTCSCQSLRPLANVRILATR